MLYLDVTIPKQLMTKKRKSSFNGAGRLVFVDAALGGGGHSLALLQHMRPEDVLIGCDRDPMALETASCRLREYIDQGMFIPHRTNFKDLGSSLLSVKEYKDAGGAADGLLMDLGVSSYQIDSADRGFSFSKDGPLDMRMDNSRDDQLTAADICNEYGESGIIDILRTFADESTPRARKIAKSIIDNRPLTTTTDLVNAVAAVTPAFAKNSRRMGRTATLARVFQTTRMIVNEEDSSLAEDRGSRNSCSFHRPTWWEACSFDVP